MDFFKTGLGKQLLQRHIPEFIRQLRELNKNIKTLSTHLSDKRNVWVVTERNTCRTVHFFPTENLAKEMEKKIKKELDDSFGEQAQHLYPEVVKYEMDNREKTEKIGSEMWKQKYDI